MRYFSTRSTQPPMNASWVGVKRVPAISRPSAPIELVPPPTALRWAFAYEILPEDFFGTTCAKAPRKRGRE